MSQKVDSVTLTAVIDQCLDYSMDGRFTQPQRSEFLALAKRLRGSLLNLLSARFNDGTAALVSANASLAAVNKQLKEKAEALDNAAQLLANLASVVGSLDKLIGVAAGFL